MKSFPILLSEVHYIEMFVYIPYLFFPADQPHRIYTLEKLHPPRREARQLPDGPRQKGKSSVHDRLWTCKKISRRAHTPAHPVPRKQESDRHRTVCQHQHTLRNRWVYADIADNCMVDIQIGYYDTHGLCCRVPVILVSFYLLRTDMRMV